MKQLFIIALFAALFAQTANCQTPGDPITFTLSIVDPITGTTNPNPKTPVTPPSVFISGNTFLFPTAYAESLPIVLTDNTGTIVYYSALPAGSTSLILPSTISGPYILYIYMDGYIFCGQINL
ncbi:MAG: hypothetical protein IJ928_12760 [Prevotella sp.]|nr:hypothetical protein [Prevotella sp.]